MSGKSWTKAEAQQMFFSPGEGVLPWTYEVSREGVTTDLAKSTKLPTGHTPVNQRCAKMLGLARYYLLVCALLC